MMLRLLAYKIFFLLILLVPTASYGWDVSTALIDQWKMNDNAASTVVIGSNSDGTLIGGNNTQDISVTGKVNEALDLDGSADFIQVDSLITDCANETDGAIAFWAKIDLDDGVNNDVFVMGRDTDATSEIFAVIFNMINDRINCYLNFEGTTDWYFHSGNDSLDSYVGDFVFVVINHDGTTPSLYINASSVSITWVDETDKTKWWKSIITDSTTPVDNTNLGVWETGGSDSGYFDGAIDNVMVFDRSLTQSEIDGLYNSGNGTEALSGADAGVGAQIKLKPIVGKVQQLRTA